MPNERNIQNRALIDKALLQARAYKPRLPGAKHIISDIDGTIANSEGIRSPYDEANVILDKPYPVVAEWVQELYKDFNLFLASGRHDWCGVKTEQWFNIHKIPFDLLLMRPSKDNRHDGIIKQEILDLILTNIPKEDILFVIDDRPRVVEVWKNNGLMCIPVRGTTKHIKDCPYDSKEKMKGLKRCPKCWALEDF